MSEKAAPKKVLGIGLAALDQLVLWEDVGRPVREAAVADCAVQGGGMIGTALVTVARLGGAAEYLGAVGTDWVGDVILGRLRAEGVRADRVNRSPTAASPLVLVSVDAATGGRRVLCTRGMPRSDESPEGPPDLEGAGCLLIDGFLRTMAVSAARRARRQGVPVVGDVGGVGDEFRELVSLMDHAICSQACAEQLTGGDYREACRQVQSMGPGHVTITLGERGLVALIGDRFVEMPAFEVDVVDTTGAGDVFHGAFCWGLVEGLGLTENLRFASAAAALACRRLGGRAAIPTRGEVEGLIAQSR